jgi:hypothetical protein
VAADRLRSLFLALHQERIIFRDPSITPASAIRRQARRRGRGRPVLARRLPHARRFVPHGQRAGGDASGDVVADPDTGRHVCWCYCAAQPHPVRRPAKKSSATTPDLTALLPSPHLPASITVEVTCGVPGQAYEQGFCAGLSRLGEQSAGRRRARLRLDQRRGGRQSPWSSRFSPRGCRIRGTAFDKTVTAEALSREIT